MYRKNRKKITALLAGLLGVSLLFAGCGKESGQGIFGGAGGKNPGGAGGGAPAQAEQNKNITGLARGRYAEYEIPFEENSYMHYPARVYVDAEGLYLLDLMGFDAKVRLEGCSWDDDQKSPKMVNIKRSSLPEPLYKRIQASDYFSEMEMAENGARMYTCFVSDADNDTVFYQDKYFLGADGTEKPWSADGAVSRESSAFYVRGDDGNFYVLVRETEEKGRLYRVDSGSGETKYLMDFSELEDRVSNIQVFGGRIYATAYDKLHIFDLATFAELEEDKVLTELIGDSCLKGNGNYAAGFLLCPGRDDSVYVATEKGLYRHVLYGSVSELLVDGTLTSLGDISNLYAGMYVDEEGENGMPVFYILYDTAKLVRFAYDPELPAAPEKTIVLYSLTESDDIRRMISSYQARQPEIYVRYEIGMSGKDGTTRQDALNALATRIAAGEGPDVFLMDDLPYRAYAEKGVLMDMSGIYAELKAGQKYFDNIIGALYRGDKLYSIPMLFAVPMLVGDKSALAGITDIESMVRAVENSSVAQDAMRVGFWDAANTLRGMSYTCSGRWLDQSGSLDREALTEFLRICKRIYEADVTDRSGEKLEARMAIYNDYIGQAYVSGWRYRYSGRLSNAALDKVMYGNAFAVGLMSGDINVEFNYNYALIEKAKAGYMLMPGDGRTALPYAMLGINAATPIRADAEEFVKYALSDYLREGKYLSGIPISRDVLLDMERNNPNQDTDKMLSYAIGFVSDDGEDVIVDVDAPWRDMAVYEEYNAILDSLDSVNLCEYELLSAVLENGGPALTGEKSIEETVDAIAKKVQLYLAE